jgi:predicted DNA-binding protein (MmcQ/YjbR family)
MKHKQVEKFILSLPDSKLDYPFGEDVAVYKAFVPSSDDWKMFALIAENSNPVRISLKCDPKLSEVLRSKYESVMPGYHLSKKHWNTIILTGQLPWEDIQALIKHSYSLIVKTKSDTPSID